MLIKGFLKLCRLEIRQTHVFEHIPPRAQRAVEEFAHDVIGSCLIEAKYMGPVARPRDDVKIGAFAARKGDKAHGGLGIVEGGHKNARLVQAGGMQKIGARRVAKEPLDAKAAHALDRV